MKNLRDEDPPYDFDFDGTQVINHEEYDPSELTNDIALINVTEFPFDFSNKKIAKIDLGIMSLDEMVGKTGRIAGW